MPLNNHSTENTIYLMLQTDCKVKNPEQIFNINLFV